MGSDARPTLVVGVGASAGGLEAFKLLLGALPADRGMAFLLVQHLDPNHKSVLTDLLAPLTHMVVRDADDGLRLEPDTVYIIRPDTALGVQGGRIVLSTPTLHRGVRLPVDHLFRSLAKEYGPRAVGIVLSGAGSDGSAGIRDIKAAGGLVIAQDPDASGQAGMPSSAIQTGLVDLVLQISDMPAALERFAALPVSARVAESDLHEEEETVAERPAGLSDSALGRLAAVLEAQLSFDLRVYKTATIERRVLRRLALSGFDSVETYLEHVRSDPEEQQTLVRDLLISVTEFFRDPVAFKTLREMVIDPAVLEAAPGSILRAWVPGCATGEEAYSLAIEFLEAIESHDKRIGLQVFATDVDQEALTFARAATYPPSIADHVSERRLSTYFKALDGKGYQVRPGLRDVVSFAAHDLTKDPPFSRMHLVSCRNVLIYLTSEAQKHVLRVLHFALEPKGSLFLSTSESTGPQRELFATLSKAQRIYRKVGPSRPIAVQRSRQRPHTVHSDATVRPEASPRLPKEGDQARRAVLEAIAPPTLVVAADGSVLFAHGDLHPYLRIPQGESPRFDLASVLRSELATRVRGVLYKCRRSGEAQFASAGLDAAGGGVRISAHPALALGDDVVVLTFEPTADVGQVAVVERGEAGQDELLNQLEKELLATREDLRSTVEELETSNEELRSANEESMSMNEELQSANEELEATTEELRSLNEELTTVNAQLREKIDQVELAHDDLSNFFSSTKVATVFLDEGACIKRFTPAARDLLGIDHADVGRFVGDIARELLQHHLAEDATAVLDDLMSHAREVRTTDGRWIVRQCLPYRTESRRIEGVVVTFSDVTELRAANDELERRARRLELAWEAASGGVVEHEIPFDDSTYVSEEWANVLGYRSEEVPADETLPAWIAERAHPEDRAKLDPVYERAAEGGTDRFSIELRLRHRAGHWIWVRKIVKVLARDKRDSASHVLRMMIDITDLKETEASLRDSEERFRTLADNISQLAWTCDRLGQATWYNRRWYEFTGTTWEEMKGGGWSKVHDPAHLPRVSAGLEAAVASGEPWEDSFPLRGADGTWRWFLSRAIPIRNEAGEITRWFGTNTDVTELREVEERLVEADRRKNEFMAMLGHELRNPLAAIRTAAEVIKVQAGSDAPMARPRQVLERQSGHMAKLLDGLLDVSRIVLGKIGLETEVLDLRAVVRDVVDDLRDPATERGLRLDLDIAEGGVIVDADPVRMAQVVTNLLANALAYTPEGGSVEVTLSRDAESASLSVRDTGMGIDAELLPEVFEPFRQSKQTLDRSRGGLGLGLALVKSLVELHGGRVSASSAGPGAGAEFVVHLPLSRDPFRGDPSQDGARIPARRILIIEDNADAAEMLGRMLELHGHEVTVAATGDAGLRQAREDRPDIILCDLGLPGGLSGFDVAASVRADGGSGPLMIALSGYGRPEDRARSLEAGFDAHLTKPVTAEVLARSLESLARSRPKADP